jgi:hypothetical protein
MPLQLPALSQIQQVVRFLTKSPSANQLSDNFINDQVNNFILYDFPNAVKLFDLRKTVTWYCEPYIDTYQTDNTVIPVTNPLYNFKQKYVAVEPPVYVAGYRAGYYQSREQFYGEWPQIDSIIQIAVGDGATTVFAGYINGAPQPPAGPGVNVAQPFLQNNVLISSIDTNGNGIAIIDSPINSLTGNLVPALGPNSLPPLGTINYITGAYTLNTGAPLGQIPALGAPINAQVYYYVPSRPLCVLWFDDEFILRPVPDQPYQINLEVYAQPTALLEDPNAMPDIWQWWQYIAYGAARKVLQLRFDYDSLALIEPEFLRQQSLVLTKTVMQNTTQRVQTIYSQQDNMGGGWGNWNGYGQSGI